MRKKSYCEYVSKYKKDLYIMANAILNHETDAEDAVSNAILKGYEKIGQLRSLQKFRPWMLTITKNEALKIKKKRLGLSGNETVEAMLSPARDHYDELWDILQKMKEEYRLVVVLFYYEELSLKEISTVLNIPVGTVKSRLSRGKEIIKEALEKGGWK